ncbi:MAG TPA: hypothetical protein VGB91_05685 [Rhizomicrobium sp.]
MDIRTLASPALVKRGCINVIGLEHLRTRIGARWEKSSPSIHARLESMLSHKLGPTDFFTRLSDTAYLVAMPSFEGDEARLCCLKIAYELHRSLLGTCTVDDLSLARVAGDGIDALELHPIRRAELLVLAARGGLEELCAGVPGGVGQSIRGLRNMQIEQAPAVYRFAPVWDVAHETVTAYRLVTQSAPPAKRARSWLPPDDFKVELANLLGGLSHAATMLAAGMRSGGRFLMIVPIAFDLISSPAGRMEIASACRALPAPLRPFLIFEISEMPVGVPQSRMSDLICSVRPFCRAVSIQISRWSGEHPQFQNAGHQGLSLDLASAPMPPRIREDIVKMAGACRRAGLTSVVGGVQSLALADCARRAGIGYLCGPLVGFEMDVPAAMRRLPWNRLVAQNVDAVRAAG